MRLHLSSKLFHRTFNGDFEHGGRWYGPAWQNLPKKQRSHLTIDGLPTCELDILSCHPRLLCASMGLQLPFHDPSYDFYRLPSFERGEVKLAFNVLLNAPREGPRALADALRKLGVADARARSADLCNAVTNAWPALAPCWSTGIGLRLQRVDADICARVQAELRVVGVPVLSIHDSFIVPARDRPALQDAMYVTMKEAGERLRSHPLKMPAADGS
jgi:hypothetical protein